MVYNIGVMNPHRDALTFLAAFDVCQEAGKVDLRVNNFSTFGRPLCCFADEFAHAVEGNFPLGHDLFEPTAIFWFWCRDTINPKLQTITRSPPTIKRS